MSEQEQSVPPSPAVPPASPSPSPASPASPASLVEVVAATEVARRAVLEAAVEAAGIGTFDWDLVANVITWDERMLEMFGYRPGTFDGTYDAFAARLHPGDVNRVAAAVGEALEGCSTLAVEYRVVRPDGTTLWVAARGRVLCDENGAAVRIIGASYDTTAERDADAHVARVMDSMATAFFALDRDWRFTYLNAEAERVLGRNAGELLGEDVWMQFPLALGSDFETYYRGAVQTGEPASFRAYYPDPLNAWYEVRAWPHPGGLAVYFLDVTDQQAAEEAAAVALTRASLLGRVGDALSPTAEPSEAIGGLARLVVPELADWAIVTLIDDARQPGSRASLRDVGAWHRDPAMREVAARYARERLAVMADDAIVVRAVESGQEQVIDADARNAIRAMLTPGQALEDITALDPYAVAVLPLHGSEQPVGILTLCNGRERGGFSDEALAFAREVAARAGIILDQARLYRQQRDLAEGLQRSLLTEPPVADDLRIAVRYIAAAEATRVGGDWYDAFLQRDGSAVLVIGDVMGHDLSAAAAMGQVRTLVRGIAALSGGRPAEVLAQVDEVIETLRLDTTATVVVARLEPEEAPRRRAGDPPTTGRRVRLRWSNAGHPPPILVRADGKVQVLTGDPDVLLGVVAGTPRHEQVVEMVAPSTVLLYTDGLIERHDEAVTDGIDRLAAVVGEVAGMGLEELCDEVLRRMLPARPDDDIALVAYRILP